MMKSPLANMAKNLRKHGYVLREKLWYCDGLYTISNRKPTHHTNLPWEPRWFFYKQNESTRFHIQAYLSDDGGAQYAVLDLAAYQKDGINLHTRHGLRGAHPYFSIKEIVAADIKNMETFENLLMDAIQLAHARSQTIR